jgi:carboxypeptidase C (cathepsin A)
VGRLDSRYTGADRDSAGEKFEFDPAMAEIRGAYSAAMNAYLRSELKFDADSPYEVTRPLWMDWGWKDFSNRYAAIGDSLRKAMTVNPRMRVLVASGWYDLATPHFAADYTFNHLGLPEELRANLEFSYYEAGHMMYAHKPSLEKLAGLLRRFVKG